MRHTKKKNRQLTVAMAAVAFSLSAAAVDAYASSVTDTQEQVMIEDEETIEIDPNNTYVSGTTGWVMEGGYWCYYINGIKQTGSIYMQEGEYLLDANGHMVTGWYRESADAPYFYYDPLKGGVKANGLTTVNGVTY